MDFAEAGQSKVLEQFATYATCADEKDAGLVAVSLMRLKGELNWRTCLMSV